MVFLRGKEKRVEALYRTHIEQVNKCLLILAEALDCYLAGDNRYRELSLKVHHTEHDADSIRREIEKEVQDGAFLAVFRGDFIWLAESIDKVANLAESISDVLVTETPQIPPKLGDEYRKLLHSSIEAFLPFTSIKSVISDSTESVLKVAQCVEEKEQESDKIEFNLLKEIFESPIDLARKLQLKDLAKKLGGIANLCEDASDRLEVMVAKRRM